MIENLLLKFVVAEKVAVNLAFSFRLNKEYYCSVLEKKKVS